MKELGKITQNDKGQVFLELGFDRLLMSNTLTFYLISEMSHYEREETVKAFKEKYRELILALQTGKNANAILLEKVG